MFLYSHQSLYGNQHGFPWFLFRSVNQKDDGGSAFALFFLWTHSSSSITMHPLSGSQKLEKKLLPLYCICSFFSLVPFPVCIFCMYRKNCGEVHLINAIIYSRLSRLRTIECTRCNDYICLIFVLCSQRPKQIHQIIVSFPCILFF